MKPDFSQGYVVRETLKHMKRCVTISQEKTIKRLAEFENNSAAALVVLSTLSSLDKLSKLCDSMIAENKELLKEDNK